MSKFDLVFEQALSYIREKQEYVDSTFIDNVRLLIKALKDNDYISPKRDVEHVVQSVVRQSANVKELILDTKEQSLPAVKLKIKQGEDPESFSVTVINIEGDPSEQKEYSSQNSFLETVFKDVIDHIKMMVLQGAKPEAAVDELPPSEGGNAQPGGQESALPQGEQAPQQPPA